MSERGQRAGAAMAAALGELDAALVCLQAPGGCAQQASLHLERGRCALEEGEQGRGGAAAHSLEQALAQAGQARSLAHRRAVAADLRRLIKQLRAHPGAAAVAPSGEIDRLGMWGKGVFLTALLLLAGAMTFGGPELSEAEQTAAGGRRSTGGAPEIKLTLAQVQHKYVGKGFSHLLKGFPFKERARIQLGRRRPLFGMSIALLNSQIHRITLMRGQQKVHSFYLGPRTVPWGMCKYNINLRHTTAPEGVDYLLVEGVDGEGDFELGPVQIKDWDDKP